MPVLDAVQTFPGIANENEFYSHHYLAEVFKGDIKSRIEAWEAAEASEAALASAAAAGSATATPARAPHKALSACAQRWFALRSQLNRERDPAARWSLHTQIQALMLQALGYAASPAAPQVVEFLAGSPLPVWHVLTTAGADQGAAASQAPHLVIVPAFDPTRHGLEDEPALDQTLAALHYAGLPVPDALSKETWADLIGDALFSADAPPRYVILAGPADWLLLDRYKWPNNLSLIHI